MQYRSFVLLFLFFLLPLSVSAQSALGGMPDADPFTVSVTPEYPAPGGSATLSFLSSTLSLAASSMTVSVNGKQTFSGNVQSVAVPLGKSGRVVSVVVKITTNGVISSQSLKIQPESVSLSTEPVASAPVLYAGKPLVPLGGATRVVAVADFRDATGALLDPATLSYAWMVDTTRIGNASGIGKNALIVASPLQYRSRTVSVVVTTASGNLVGGASVHLSPVSPTVRMYANDPLLGVRFDHALSGSYTITDTEAGMFAAPFSFALSTGAPVLQWFLNGARAQTGNTITLRPGGSGKGSASLSVTASDGANTTAVASLSLLFGTGSTNLFGL